MKRRKHHVDVPAITPGAAATVVPASPLNSPLNTTMMGYGPNGSDQVALNDISEIAAFSQKWPVVWIDIDGLGNVELAQSLATLYGLDRLVLEDIFDTGHLPKLEEYDNYLFMILKNGLFDEVFQTEQISMILMEKVVITFQERPGDSFNQVRKRIRSATGRICKFGSDYLAYAIIDAVIESYYPIMEIIKKRLDALEDNFLTSSGSEVIGQIHAIKNDLLFLHSAIWPVHNITIALAHDDLPVITTATSHFLRDCQDQAKRVTELSEFYRMIAGDLIATYLAYSDSNANQVMKLLTMVTTIFIPLSFIVGLYGMNFDRSASPYNMPELGWRYGYPIVLLSMLAIACAIMYMFKRKGWFKTRT